MSRLDAIRTAARPKMHGRALISGPSGAGKTWTGLSMATVLADGNLDRVLVIDTERESALTYADVFAGFQHLPWRPPFDPTELSETMDALGDQYAVVIVDSLSHFWRSQGGTLAIADGKIGGWKNARPVQERLVQSLLAVPAHLLLCVRSKMEYLIEGGKANQTVTKLGLSPIQDDTLVYEVNIALDLDLEHRLTVTKSRTPAVPVGRMYPAGLERKAAEDYAAWLAGGVPPASREDVDTIVGMFAEISDGEQRARSKQMFVELFGMPHSLTADSVAEARSWLTEHLASLASRENPHEGAGADGPVSGGDAGADGETTPETGPLDAASSDGADGHDVGRTGPEPASTSNGAGVPPPPDGDTPAPPPATNGDQVLSVKDLAQRSNLAFRRAGEEQAPHRRKTETLERLRHAVIYLRTGGAKASLAGLDAAEMADVWAYLGDICEGRTVYSYDLDPAKGVEFEHADGRHATVLWGELVEVVAS